MLKPPALAVAGLLMLACAVPASAAPPACTPALWPPTARTVVPLKAGELRLLSQTIYAEARGEGLCAMAAVAHVIINRMRDRTGQYGTGLKGVVHRPWQFSVWNGDRAKLSAVDSNDPSYVLAQLAASGVLTGMLPDPTAGATHFVNTLIPTPTWARRMVLTASIGGHRFYKLDK